VKSEWLSDMGRIGVRKLIREEQRKNIEWRVKVIALLLGACINILGLDVIEPERLSLAVEKTAGDKLKKKAKQG